MIIAEKSSVAGAQASLKETAGGGLATTPTGRKLRDKVLGIT